MIPNDLSLINTNIPQSEMITVLRAMENSWVIWSSHMEYNGSRIATCAYKGELYQLEEYYETVTGLYRVGRCK